MSRFSLLAKVEACSAVAVIVTVLFSIFVLSTPGDWVPVVAIGTSTIAWATLAGVSHGQRRATSPGAHTSKTRWALNPRDRWMLAGVTPAASAVVLFVHFDVSEINPTSSTSGGGDLVVLIVILFVVPWLLGPILWFLVGLPLRVVFDALRLERARRWEALVKILFSTAALLAVFACVASAQAFDTPPFGRPDAAVTMIESLLGVDGEVVRSEGWAIAARSGFIAAIALLIAAFPIDRLDRGARALRSEGMPTT